MTSNTLLPPSVIRSYLERGALLAARWAALNRATRCSRVSPTGPALDDAEDLELGWGVVEVKRVASLTLRGPDREAIVARSVTVFFRSPLWLRKISGFIFSSKGPFFGGGCHDTENVMRFYLAKLIREKFRLASVGLVYFVGNSSGNGKEADESVEPQHSCGCGSGSRSVTSLT